MTILQLMCYLDLLVFVLFIYFLFKDISEETIPEFEPIPEPPEYPPAEDFSLILDTYIKDLQSYLARNSKTNIDGI